MHIDAEAHWKDQYEQVMTIYNSAIKNKIDKLLIISNSDHVINSCRLLRKYGKVEYVHVLVLSKDLDSNNVKIHTTLVASNGAMTDYPNGFLDGWSELCENLWANTPSLDEIEQMNNKLKKRGLTAWVKWPK